MEKYIEEGRFLNWKDILKAEIQVIPNATTADGDVNVDLEDDDCIRWVKKLVELFKEIPKTGVTDGFYDPINKEYFDEKLLTEEIACNFKEVVSSGKLDYRSATMDYGLGFETGLYPSIKAEDILVQNGIVSSEDLLSIELDITFIQVSLGDGSIVSLSREGTITNENVKKLETTLKKIYRHCSWETSGLNKFFTNFRSNYNTDNVEKTTGAVTTSSPSAVSGKLFNISYGGKKRGKKRQSKKEDY